MARMIVVTKRGAAGRRSRGRGFGTRIRRAWAELVGGGAASAHNTRSFKGAEISRLTNDWIATGSTPDDELRGNLKLLRRRARDLARNNPFAERYLSMVKENVVGPNGPDLQAQNTLPNGELDHDANEAIEEAWHEYSNGPVTRDGKHTFVQLLHMQAETLARDGEFFQRRFFDARNPFGLTIEPIDPDQVDEALIRTRTPRDNEIRMGIEVDGHGAPVGYHLFEDAYRPFNSSPRRIRVPAADVDHGYWSRRPNQTRGVTWLAPVMMPLHILDQYIEAVLFSARVGAEQMVFFERDEDSAEDPSADIESEGEGTAESEQAMEIETAPGLAQALPIGWKVKEWSPNQPNQDFGPFVQEILRGFSSGMSISYNVLANNWVGVSFSSLRQSMGVERDSWKLKQVFMIQSLVQPVYEAWLNTALLTGKLQLGSRDWRRYRKALWTPKGWPYLDPMKDIQAAVLAIDNGLASHQQMVADHGRDFEDIVTQLKREKELLEREGLELGKRTGKIPQVSSEREDDDEREEEDEDESGREARSRSNGVLTGFSR